MDNKDFNNRMTDFQKRIDQLSPVQQEQIASMVTETRQRYEQISETSERLDHAVRDLMILSAYQRFDIEATRREYIALKQQLEQQQKENDNQPENPNDFD